MMSEENRDEMFLRKLVGAQDLLKGYLMVHMKDHEKVEDVMQEVSIVLWRKFNEYDESRSFTRWATGVARNFVLRSRRDFMRSRLIFDDELAEHFAASYEAFEPKIDERRKALRGCLGKISNSARQLIDLRYDQHFSAKDVAGKLNKKVNAVNTALTRVRTQLANCIERTLGTRNEGIVE